MTSNTMLSERGNVVNLDSCTSIDLCAAAAYFFNAKAAAKMVASYGYAQHMNDKEKGNSDIYGPLMAMLDLMEKVTPEVEDMFQQQQLITGYETLYKTQKLISLITTICDEAGSLSYEGCQHREAMIRTMSLISEELMRVESLVHESGLLDKAA